MNEFTADRDSPARGSLPTTKEASALRSGDRCGDRCVKVCSQLENDGARFRYSYVEYLVLTR